MKTGFKMFLSVSVFVLVVMVCSGSAAPALLQNSKKTRVAATTNRDYNNRMKRSPEADGIAAEDYLLIGTETIQISQYTIIYRKSGGYNKAKADFDYLTIPEYRKTTKWERHGLTHIYGVVGDRVLILTDDKANKAAVLALVRKDQGTGTAYTQRFVYRG